MHNKQFTLATVNPQNLSIHPLLLETGYDSRPDQYFIQALKDLGLYERPIVADDKILTHCAEVLAAQANGVTALDAFIVNMTEIELRLLIALKHKYNIADLFKSYHSIKFYEDYLNSNVEGIELAKTLKGDINDKIAMLMHASAPTIKRLKRIGDHKYEKLGLIQQRELSMKEVLYEIRMEKMALNQETKRAEDEESKKGPDVSTIQLAKHQKVEADEGNEYYDADADLNEDEMGNKNEEINTTSSPAINFEQASFTIGNIGQLDVTVSDNTPQVLINGQPIANLNYQYYVNRDSAENGKSESIVISQSGKKPFMMQITFENLPKAA